MEEFRFIPNDVIYVEATSVDPSKSIEDIDVDFYRNIFKFGEKRFVYLPEVVRYFMPNIEFDKQIFSIRLRLTGEGYNQSITSSTAKYIMDLHKALYSAYRIGSISSLK